MCRKCRLSLCAKNLRMNSVKYFQSNESSYVVGSNRWQIQFFFVCQPRKKKVFCCFSHESTRCCKWKHCSSVCDRKQWGHCLSFRESLLEISPKQVTVSVNQLMTVMFKISFTTMHSYIYTLILHLLSFSTNETQISSHTHLGFFSFS